MFKIFLDCLKSSPSGTPYEYRFPSVRRRRRRPPLSLRRSVDVTIFRATQRDQNRAYSALTPMWKGVPARWKNDDENLQVSGRSEAEKILRLRFLWVEEISNASAHLEARGQEQNHGFPGLEDDGGL